MLKIRAIKLVVHSTNDQVFGAEYTFASGLNIVRGDNSAGKSTLYHSLLYGLGVEELLDGRNEKVLQSVLKESIQYDQQIYEVLESYVCLEIESSSIVTVKRSIKSRNRNPKLVEVYFGALLTGVVPVERVEPMYVHDKGAASDALYGFHAFLQKFMAWQLPDVVGSLGDTRSLYIQSVFPAFVIEQKRGWSDFLATMPYFGVKDSESRVIEFLLGLDVIANRKKKQELIQARQNITARWQLVHQDLIGTAKRGNIEVQGFAELPEILADNAAIVFNARYQGERTSATALVGKMREELAQLATIPIETSGTKVGDNQRLLKELTQQLNEFSLNNTVLANRITMTKLQVDQYQTQLLELTEDLEKNKGARKIYDLGANEQLSIATSHCPTCHQDIKDTLMPQAVTQTPMRIEENIAYLDAQRKMLELQLSIQTKVLAEDVDLYETHSEYVDEIRSRIRTLQSELVADSRAPSEADIEKRVKLKANIGFYVKLIDELTIKANALNTLSEEWKQYLAAERALPTDFFSVNDRKKLKEFENTFKTLLSRFGYSSALLANVQISQDKYTPVIQSETARYSISTVRYNIRSDSSATDLVRAIWAYTCSLRRVSDQFGSNHPKLLMFDEPAQHSMSDENFRTFLQELASYKEGQSLVFASFNNSDQEFESITQDIGFSLTRIQGKLIKPVSSSMS